MNYVAFDPSNLSGEDREWWSSWYRKAENATTEAIRHADAGEKIVFHSTIWSKLKRWLLENVFNGKCAYCESTLTVTDYGDADHYRPKASLSDMPDHNGYYWVAYDWHNLVPCCSRCNTGGKRDSFPIAGNRVLSREEAADFSALDEIEKPLLLHPYKNGDDHPMKHLVFNEFGHVKPRNGSEKGRISIKVYDLSRKKLRDERRTSQNHAWLRFKDILDSPLAERDSFLKKFCDGKEKHSAAVLNYIDQRIEELDHERSQCRTWDR
jgi:uncharacterized protein (TIGR02646 family)